MDTIKCENPTILLNSEFCKAVVKSKIYYTPRGFTEITNVQAYAWSLDFPTYYFNFHKSKSNQFYKNIDDYYTVDFNGVVIPMYIQVPCGKCILCKDRKAREYQFRSEAEASISDTEVLFLTLTYDDCHLPQKGVEKRDVQLFLKRLRINLTNDGIKHNLRYLCVGEYGKNTHRAHYHLELYNFPRYSVNLRTLPQVNDYIKKAWQNGFIYLVPAEKGCTKYITKYMVKECKVPEGKNPVFMLSSRKNGGIGSNYFKENKERFIENPQEYKCIVNNKGQIFSSVLGQYGKRIIFPPLSSMIPHEIRQCYHDFRVTLHQLSTISTLLFDYNYKFTRYKDILKKYKPLGFRYCKTDTPFDYMQYAKKNFGQLCDAIRFYEKRCDYLAKILRSYEFNTEEYYKILASKTKRIEYQSLIVKTLTKDDVKYQSEELRKKIAQQAHKEIL